ncbi:FlgD immunoglobulin-like domain containing protein [Gemmatimonadota bacterium]
MPNPPSRSRQVLFLRGLFVISAIGILATMITSGPPGSPVKNSREEIVPLSDAMASMQFLTAQRAYPLEDIPAGAYSSAFDRAEPGIRMARQQGSIGAAETLPVPPPWQPIGPKNLGGRTIALAINPINAQVIYAGSASGGLWRTDTGGLGADAWHYIDISSAIEDFPVLGVNAIAIDPSDTSTIYIGTGEVYNRANSMGSIYIRTTRGSYGIGLLKSSDSGLTWEKSIDWEYDERRGVLDIVIDPHDPSRVFAGTSEGVYRTTNAGATWDLVLDVQMAVDIAVNPDQSDTLYASCGNLETPSDGGIGIYRSFDGGDSWTKLNESGEVLPLSWTGKTLLDIYQASPNVIYADVANMFSDSDSTGVALYRSLDNGDSWERLTWNNINSNSEYCCTDPIFDNINDHGYHMISSYQGWFSHFVIVHPSDSSQVLVGGVDSYKSTDGGRSFIRISKWNDWKRGQVPAGEPEGINEHYSHADHHSFARHPSEANTVFWGNDGGVFKTENFGDSFTARNGGYQTAQFYYGFSSSPVTADLAIGGLQDNSTVLYEGTTDWKRIFGGDGASTALHATDTNYIIGSSQRGRIYRSEDRGNNYWYTNSNAYNDGTAVCFVAPIAQAPSSPGVLYTGRTRIYKSINYAQSWVLPAGTTELSGAPIVSISVSGDDPALLWATTVPDPPIAAGVFLSTNGGSSWTDVTRDLPDRYPMDIVAAYWDQNIAYVTFSGFGTEHLYRTIDAGVTWEALGVGQLPDIPTSAFAIDPYNRKYLYLGNDFGVWFSPDAGENWEPFTDGMPTGALIMDLSVSPINWSLRAVTHGLGIWERPLVSAAAAEGDTIPPTFDLGIHRNSVLPDYLDIYFAPSEILPAVPAAEVNSSPLVLTTISTTEGILYLADYKLSGSGIYSISITSTDFAGNDSTSVFSFNAQLLGGATAGALSTADGAFLLSLPPEALSTPEYVVAYRIPIDADSRWTLLRRPGEREGIAFEQLGGDEDVLSVWSILPGERTLVRDARLLLVWDRDALGDRDTSSLIIERWSGQVWEPLKSYVDQSRSRIETSISRLGVYRLRSSSSATGPDPLRSGLEQNYPNPFNGSTNIRYSLVRSADVQLYILNVRGQRVKTLVDGILGPGSHVVNWEGRDDDGQALATGVYLIALHIDGAMFTRKALYIR